MPTEVASEFDVEKARRVWAEYQLAHDLTERKGEAVGVDPNSGEVFFGRSAGEIIDKLRAEGRFRYLMYWRIGYPCYSRARFRLRRIPPQDD